MLCADVGGACFSGFGERAAALLIRRGAAKAPLRPERGSKSRAAPWPPLRFAFRAALFLRFRVANATSGAKSRAARRKIIFARRPPLLPVYGGQEKIKAQKFFSRTITPSAARRHEKNFCPLARRFAALIFVPSPVPPKLRGRAARFSRDFKKRRCFS